MQGYSREQCQAPWQSGIAAAATLPTSHIKSSSARRSGHSTSLRPASDICRSEQGGKPCLAMHHTSVLDLVLRS